MRRALSFVLLVSVLPAVAACGGGGAAAIVPPSSAPLSLAFGSLQAAGAIGDVEIRVLNYSGEAIVDLGLRPLGSDEPWRGRLHTLGRTGAAAVLAGHTPWVTVPAGAYEVYVETPHGRLEIAGHTAEAHLPDGTLVAAPTDLYLFGREMQPAR